MDNAQLETEIKEVKGDIKSLEIEVGELDNEYFSLLSQAKDLKESLNTAQPSTNGEEAQKPPKINYDIEDPPVIQHNYFDESISKFFMKIPELDEKDVENEEQCSKRQKLNEYSSKMMENSKAIIESKENILYENIYRFGGLTTFPLNNFLFENAEQVLGLRFDSFSHYTKKFLTPQYVVLRKAHYSQKGTDTTLKWEIYRHTLPVYIPVSEYSNLLLEHEETGLQNFALKVKKSLMEVQYKRDKLDSLQELKFRHTLDTTCSRQERLVVVGVEKDLSCKTIKITLLSHQKRAPVIDISCTDNSIEEAACVFTDIPHDDRTIMLCENLLRNCEFKDLMKTFKKVINHLIKNRII